MRRRKAHVGEDIWFCLVHEGSELGQFGTELIGHPAPLLSGGLSIILGESRGDESGDDAAAAAARMGEHVAHEVDAAALPGGVEHFGDREGIRNDV